MGIISHCLIIFLTALLYKKNKKQPWCIFILKPAASEFKTERRSQDLSCLKKWPQPLIEEELSVRLRSKIRDIMLMKTVDLRKSVFICKCNCYKQWHADWLIMMIPISLSHSSSGAHQSTDWWAPENHSRCLTVTALHVFSRGRLLSWQIFWHFDIIELGRRLR